MNHMSHMLSLISLIGQIRDEPQTSLFAGSLFDLFGGGFSSNKTQIFNNLGI